MSSRPPSPFAATCVVGSLVVAAWVPRLLAAVERGFAATPRGFVADLGWALALAPLWFLLARPGRLAGVGRGVLAALWVLLHWAAYEHVRALDAPLALHQIGYLGDVEFLRGSAFALSRPWILLALLVGAVAGAALPRPGRRRRAAVACLAGAAATALLLVAWPTEPGSWRGRSVVASGAHSLRLAVADATPVDDALSLPADLAGAPWASTARADQSVILLVLEGVSGAYLPTLRQAAGAPDPGIDLPRLDALARESAVAIRMVNQQRQTNRGLWALLCGRLPRARAATSYLSAVAFSGRAPEPPCLPAVMADSGRRTAFFQAAPLGFMQKDLAMPLLGFGEVREYADAAPANDEPLARSGWGVDDRTFLRRVRHEVRRLRRGGPYFLTVLTAGTHHPYAVPGEPSLERAMALLDDAVGELFDGLRDDGVLDDTLVVVTSDESAGAVAAARDAAEDSTGANAAALDLVQNHGLVLVLGDVETLEPVPRIGHPVVQSDLPLSLLDHLGLAEGAPFGGRSLFRHYADDRPIPFANTYLRRASVYRPDDAAIISCDESGGACRRQGVDGALFRLTGTAEGIAEPSPFLRRWLGLDQVGDGGVAASNAVRAGSVVPLRADRDVAVADEPSGTLLFAGQYFDLPRDVAMVVDLAGTVSGDDGWLHLRHDLVSREMQEPPVLFPVLAPGDSFVLRYRLVPPRDLHALSVRAAVSRVGDGPAASRQLRLRLDTARLTFETAPPERPAGSGPVEILRWEVDRSQEPPTLRETWRPADTDAAECVTFDDDAGAWIASGCAPGEILAGPRRYVAAGSQLSARWRLRVDTGRVRVRAVAGSRRPPIAFAQTPPLAIDAGETKDLLLQTEVEPTLNHVLLALFLADASPDASWRVESAEVAVDPP